jgi:beta-N-acetylhexosaminidase
VSGKKYIKLLLLMVLLVLFICLIENRKMRDSSLPEDITSQSEPVPEEDPEEEQEPQEEVDPVALMTDEVLSRMSVDEKIYQLFIATPEQLTGVDQVTRAGETTKQAIQDQPVGGIIYFAQNIVDREQTIEMIDNLQEYSKIGLFIAVDEEGGKVARVGKNSAMGTTSFPEMGEIGAAGSTEEAYRVGQTIGSELLELGFNLDFAPVADVNSNPDNPVIGQRAFSSDPNVAAEMVAACVEGFRDSGILCTLKHFPGHGDTDADSHYGEAKTEKTLQELQECELIPFQSGIDAGAQLIMIGHITVPNVEDESIPASLSHFFVTELLREQMGFEGLIITDSMQMQAIRDQYSSGEAAVRALEAGVDLILMPEDLTGAAEGIKAALESGELQEERIDESVRRILTAKIESGIIE